MHKKYYIFYYFLSTIYHLWYMQQTLERDIFHRISGKSVADSRGYPFPLPWYCQNNFNSYSFWQQNASFNCLFFFNSWDFSKLDWYEWCGMKKSRGLKWSNVHRDQGVILLTWFTLAIILIKAANSK